MAATVLLSILLVLMAIFPIVMMLRAWIVTRVMGGMLAVATICAHLLIPIVTWQSGQPWLAISYLIAGDLAWAILPYTGMAGDRNARIRIRRKDIARYERKISRDPSHASAHSALADAYLEEERFDEAIAAYEQAIALDPDHSRSDRWKRQQAIELRAQRQQMRGGKKKAPLNSSGPHA